MSTDETPDLPPIEIVESGVMETSPPPDPASLGLSLPEDPVEAQEVLLRALDEARNEANSYLDDLRRVAADFENFRKRMTREQQQIVERASERVVKAMLPVLDSLDAALAIEATTETEEKLLGGMRGTQAQLLDVLGKEGLEVIHAAGEGFDPEIHEAVMSSGEGDRLMVSQELRRGYRLHGRVIRASLVALEAE